MTAFLEPSDDYTAGDLVVDHPHRELVKKRIRDLGLDVTEVADSEALGLSRLHLEGVPAFGASKGLPADDVAAIELVIDELRQAFAADFGGWVPEMAPDPTMTGIVGYPHTKPMAFTTDLMPAPASQAPIADSTVGAGVRVAVLDTGLVDHPALKGHATEAPGGADAANDPVEAWAGHATFVAGLIAQRAPGCEIVVHKVLNAHGRATNWETAVALAKLADDPEGYAVVNLSLGCRLGGPNGPLALRRAVARHGRHTLLVAAAGNHGGSDKPTVPAWPAAFPGVIAVGATNLAGDLAQITPELPWVDCVAHGSGVTSTYLTDVTLTIDDKVLDFTGYATWSGTSFAAANVSGAVAAALRPGERPADTLARLLGDPASDVRPFPLSAAGHAG
ncbi:Subtilase family protein [Asanoa hainanensis]|uniref:Subtilase family protein n=1 Tax=Asanoa hainanensis TaxID=560556 RepID=A0A239GDF0_9ACTN|nr:S8/S53 family peptidase [Asanoa hainanensis]SNS67140.1 Subtilase family protein [Asanoa hainanensis]